MNMSAEKVADGATTTQGADRRPQIERSTLEDICADREDVAPGTLEVVLGLALELAREGREGRKVGTIFTIGDTESVLKRSRPLILDPLKGHPAERKRLDDPNMRETVKELAILDGGFIITNESVAVSAARYFDAASEGIDLPLGLGSRHMAGASITLHTRAVGVVVSESSVVRLFENGKIVSEIIPELWMLRRHGTDLFRESAAAQGVSEGNGPAIVLENQDL